MKTFLSGKGKKKEEKLPGSTTVKLAGAKLKAKRNCLCSGTNDADRNRH